MSTNKKVISVVLPPKLEKMIYGLRGHEEFAKCSIGEIVRRMIVIGLANEGGLTNHDELTK